MFNQEGGSKYEYNQYGCILAGDISDQERQQELLHRARLSAQGKHLTSQAEGAPFPREFDRLSALPHACQPEHLLTNLSPVETYDFLWNTFNDYYAFFSERGIDWNAVYTEAHTRLREDMSDEELFAVLKSSLSVFNDDYHVSLQRTDENAYESYEPASPKGVFATLHQGFEEQYDIDDFDIYATGIFTQFSAIHQTMMDPDSLQTISGTYEYPPYFKERVVWGTFHQGNLGYLRFNLMALDYGDDPLDTQEWIRNSAAVMDRVMNDLQNTSGMIIDMRFNGGGMDGVSFEIASRFNPLTQLPVGRITNTIEGHGNPVWAELPASTTPAYTKPVIVLTSGGVVSAGESFLLLMKSLPQVTLFGENSYGAFSDVLEKTLPNGWEFGLSNEVYFDSQNNSYEVSGILPDVQVTPFRLSDVQQGRDSALQQAIERLE